jgi:hypothetical protein
MLKKNEKGSIRKHVSQMSLAEVSFLMEQLESVKNWGLAFHARERIEERKGLNKRELVATIGNCELIEFHQRKGLNRVLIRGKKAYNGFEPCIVFDLTIKKVITFYWNEVNYKHENSGMGLYRTPNLDVISMVKGA